MLGLMGSGALLLTLGSLLAMMQIVSYPTTLLEVAGWLAIIGISALFVLALAIAGFPKMYVSPAVAVALGLFLCARRDTPRSRAPSFSSQRTLRP